MRDTIVSAEELRSNAGAWVAIDCRHSLADHAAGRRAYEQGHIPGAFFADVERDLSGERNGKNGRHPLPRDEDFAAFLRNLGVREETQIVAYDAGNDMFAARLWYMLRLIGHDAAAVLDGGFAAWTAAGYPVETAIPAPPGNGTIAPRTREELRVSSSDVLRALESGEFTLLDARGADRFAGENETMDPVAGHIPGAVNRPFRENFDERGHFKSAAQLRSEFAALNLPPQRIVHQCGSGVSAAVNMLAMEVAGQHGTRLYPGSWSEWCSDPSRPVSV